MADELIDIIDENGNVIGKKLKSEAHRTGEWHKSSHVWIVVGRKILLQKRSYSKEIFPGKFDVACAGHVKSGESYEDAAVRELEEELGIKVKKEELLFLCTRPQVTVIKEKNIISREIMKVFLLKIDDIDRLSVNRDEISELRLFDIDELRTLLKNRPEMFVDDKEYFFDVADRIEKLLES